LVLSSALINLIMNRRFHRSHLTGQEK
jgi:hypothetical protein